MSGLEEIQMEPPFTFYNGNLGAFATATRMLAIHNHVFCILLLPPAIQTPRTITNTPTTIKTPKSAAKSKILQNPR
jgi:hypothetical protein